MATPKKKVKASASKAKAKKRKSTAEPKSLIKHKKQGKATAKKKATTKKAEKSVKKDVAVSRIEKGNADADQLVKLVGKGMSIEEAAEEIGTGLRRAKRLYANATMKPSQKIVGTPKEVGKQIVQLHDEGVGWLELRVRTGMNPRQLREAYEAAGGKNVGRRGRPPKAKDEKAPKGKKEKAKAGGAPKKAARAKKSKKAKAAGPKEKSSSKRSEGRRTRRTRLREVLKEIVWNLDTEAEQVIEVLEGRHIEVSRSFQGRQIKPVVYEVHKVKDIQVHDQEGRLIEFVDQNMQTRFVSSREITALT